MEKDDEMSKKKRMTKRSTSGSGTQSQIAYLLTDAAHDMFCVPGYITLDKCPEIAAGVQQIAELIASMTIHLMENTADGDVRIINELSRTIDIEPMPNMTRMTWMQAIVKTMLLEGHGNAVVVPHTWKGYIQSLEPISASRVSFMPDTSDPYRKYRILIDGTERDPASVLHFVYNPDPVYLWKGNGLHAPLKELAKSLKQARVTKDGFLSSEWKPSLIVRVDGLTDEFSTPEGRKKLAGQYLQPSQPGEPWIIPADLLEVQQVKPLTLKDLAIEETTQLDKRTVASILGVPAFVLGVGEYKKDEWNHFIQTKIRTVAQILQQEMTRKLILSKSWYLRLNIWSLMDYNVREISDVLLAGSDRGFINGDEWRDRVNMPPAGLKEYRVLENYIPWDMAGQQTKLKGE